MADDAATASPTPYQDLNAILIAFVERLQALFANDLIAVYLQGSFALGGFDTFSDVDFMVVIAHDLGDAQLTRLQALHEGIHALPSPWARHLEGSYVPRSALASLPPPKRTFWYLDHGARHLVRSDHDDTLVVYRTTRESGVALWGPAPAELIQAVPSDLLRGEVLETMLAWRAQLLARPQAMNNRFYQPFAVVSYCRMLHTLATGAIHSKPASAAWAIAHMEPRWTALIEAAARARAGDAADKVKEPADAGDLAATWPFISSAIELAQRWTAEGSP